MFESRVYSGDNDMFIARDFRDAELSISEDLTTEEVLLFEQLLLDSLPQHYGDVDSSFPRSIVQSAASGRDRFGHFTERKRLFVGRCGERVAGFTVLTYKLGGAVKVGPTVIVPDRRREGIGRQLRLAVEYLASRQDEIRKLYLTVSRSNMVSLRFNMALGFEIEGQLQGPYRRGADEFVLSKWRDFGSAPKRESQGKIDSGAALSVNPRMEGLILESLRNRMQDHYGDVPHSFFAALTQATCRSARDFSAKAKTVFASVGDSGSLKGIAICTAKRGGSLKISPFFADDDAAFACLDAAVNHFASQCQAHRQFSLLGVQDRYNTARLLSVGFEIESRLSEPYKKGCDLIVFGRSR